MMMLSGLASRTSTRSLGRASLIDVVTTGMVIRKMISSTSIPSTNGVVLLADMAASSPSSLPAPTFKDMVDARSGLADRAQHHGVQFTAEGAHVVHDRLVATHQPVVGEHGGHGHGQANGGHQERFADRTGHLVDGCLAGDAYSGERVVDPPDGAEKTDKGRNGTNRG